MMSLRSYLALLGTVAVVVSVIACDSGSWKKLAERGHTVDVLHGVEVPDPYRWLEDGDSRETQTWEKRQNAHFDKVSDGLPQRDWLYQRFQHLWRYDDESVPRPCLLSDRIVYWTKRADQDKWIVHLRESEGAEGKVLIDPNTWEETETLAGFYPSPDCSWAAFGKAKAGNEEPILQVMNLETLEVLPDTLRGWKQRSVSWLHDNSGFYYSSHPVEGEVPDGEEFYWHRVWFHRLGSGAEDDELTFASDETKELFHGAGVSEDGRWLVLSRGQYYKRELWLQNLESNTDPVPIVDRRDTDSHVDVVGDTVYITTDWHAPNYRVMATTVDRPGRDHWESLIPESEDRLMYINPVGGKIYAVYQHNAATRISVYEPDGRHLDDIGLPTIGSASVWGYWSKPTVWLSFSSFAHPTSVFTYDPSSNGLTLYKKSPIDIDPSGIVVEQVWYPSKDGTRISMFLVHREDAPRDGTVPYMLTGYGGFNISMRPRFSTGYAVWTEAGGGVAIPNLRGGGEYGQRWHEAGMLKNKQNVFDDFIGAADWLVANDHTRRDRLAISGGSNGGLLVSAAITQRPDLCAAVLCSVPLTDMIRYHTFEYANVWAEEYGSADDPEMFEYLLGYSPYHNLVEGTDYPAMLIVASANDARTNPAHARKFSAAARWADVDHGTSQPIFYFLQDESGHGGGVTIDRKADQVAREWGFLMDQLGMRAPSG
jgi:prolyl oligopeptidase